MFKINLEVPSSEVFLTLRKKAGMGPRSIEGAEKGLGRELFSVLLEHVSTGEIVGMGRIVLKTTPYLTPFPHLRWILDPFPPSSSG